MASRGLCSLGEGALMSEAARLLFEEEPTEPDLEHLSVRPARHLDGTARTPSRGAADDI
ncbi:MAG: hypothetical protein JWO86_8709 [Myxococcaceae bacterium]|jgi:hypothetical protein|nr:hypothetical protein [Myxococcaceae bacterium]